MKYFCHHPLLAPGLYESPLKISKYESICEKNIIFIYTLQHIRGNFAYLKRLFPNLQREQRGINNVQVIKNYMKLVKKKKKNRFLFL